MQLLAKLLPFSLGPASSFLTGLSFFTSLILVNGLRLIVGVGLSFLLSRWPQNHGLRLVDNIHDALWININCVIFRFITEFPLSLQIPLIIPYCSICSLCWCGVGR